MPASAPSPRSVGLSWLLSSRVRDQSETSPRRLPVHASLRIAAAGPASGRGGGASGPPAPLRSTRRHGRRCRVRWCRAQHIPHAARGQVEVAPRGAAPAVELAASESGAPGKVARAGPAGEAVLHQIFGSPPLVPQPHLSSPAGVLRVAAAARGRAGCELMAAGWAPGDGGAAERAGGVAGARTLPRSSSRRASTTARSTSSAWSAMGESVI